MTKEQGYDEKINPLMAQIIAICNEHKIAFIADFALDEDLHCTSANLTSERNPSKAQLKAFELLKPQSGFAMSGTIQTLPNGDKKITLRRLS